MSRSKRTLPPPTDEKECLRRLSEHLHRSLPGYQPPLRWELLPSGENSRSYRLFCGLDGQKEYILRRPAISQANVISHDVGREYRYLAKLWRDFALAPRPFLFCPDESIIGHAFCILESRPGRVIRQAIPLDLDLTAPVMQRLSIRFVEVMAQLHQLDPLSLGFEDADRQSSQHSFLLNQWIRRYEQAQSREIDVMNLAGQWLRKHVPPDPEQPRLLHLGFKFDHLQVDAEDPSRIVCVFDWERAALGHPLIDLGTTFAYWVEADDPDLLPAFLMGPTALPGALTRRQFLEHYLERNPMPLNHWRFARCFGMYKLAVILQRLHQQYTRAPVKDPRFLGLGDRVLLIAQEIMRLTTAREVV